jgi:hypothetical protein
MSLMTVRYDIEAGPDMQKVETLPPADFEVKFSAYWEN